MEKKGEIIIGKIRLRRRGKPIEVILPSGRVLYYYNLNFWDDDEITLTGYDDHHRWMCKDYNASKFANEIISAVSRDILADRIMRLEESGEKVVMFYPGTVITEGTGELKNGCDVLSTLPAWADSLKPCLNAYECSSFFEKSTDVKRCY